jgi:hypothetical protein
MNPYTREYYALLFIEWSREYLIPTLRLYMISWSILIASTALAALAVTAIKMTANPKRTRT